MDSCHSASATRSTEHPSGSERVRAAPIPSGFRLQGALNQDEDSAFSVSGSHVLLSACSATGQAWESNGRGVFTVALLDLLVKTPITELSSKDIIKHLNCFAVNSDKSTSKQSRAMSCDRYIQRLYKWNGPFMYAPQCCIRHV